MKFFFNLIISSFVFITALVLGSFFYTQEVNAQCRFERHFAGTYHCCVVSASCCSQCGFASNVRGCWQQSGYGPGYFSYTEPCLTTSHPSCACSSGGGGSSVCAPGQWGGCGTNGCGSDHSSQCNSSGTGWNCVWNPGGCSGGSGSGGSGSGGSGSGCTPTNPGVVGLLSPGDNFYSETNSVTIRYSPPNTWGNGCGGTRMFLIQLSPNCTGTYTQVASLNSTTTQYTFTNLQYGTTYCWRVIASNGSRTSVSQVRRFRVNSTPVFQSLNRLTPTNMSSGDVCGNSVSGIFTTNNYDPSIANNQKTSNPVSFEVVFQDQESDAFREVYFAFIPSSGPANASANNLLEPFNTFPSKIYNARAILVRLNVSNATYQILNGVIGSNLIWSTAVSSGDITNQQGSATLLNIGSGTSFTINGNQIAARFEIRFESNGSTPFPSAGLNIYSMVGASAGPIIAYSDQNLSTRNIRRVGTWRTDLIAPIATITKPNFTSTTDFSIVWSSGDNVAVSEIKAFVSSEQPGVQIQDLTLGQTINAIGIPVNYNDLPNANISTPGATLRQYRFTDTERTVSFSQFVRDSACNITFANQRSEPPIPWIEVVNGGIYSFSNITNRLPSSSSVFNPIFGENAEPFMTDNLLLTRASTINPRLARYNLFSNSYNNKVINRIFTNSRVYGDLVSNLNNSDIRKFSFNNLTVSGRMSTQFGVSSSEKTFVEVAGNINIASNTNCDSNISFYARGNIVIQPDLLANSGNHCLFMADGNIQILAGTQKTNVLLTSSQYSSYDEINGFLFADNSIILDNDPQAYDRKWDGLRINGSLVTRNLVNNRTLNLTANLAQPAVLVDFPLAFLKTWGPEISTNKYSIREIKRIP